MKSWNKFLEEVNTAINELESLGCDNPFFRGQSNRDWHLLPSIFRRKYTTNLEGILYYDYEAYSAPLFANQRNSWDILFEMRHVGLPTRLLDWTENFAVALYFALNGDIDNPCIWILNPFKLNEESINEEVIFNPNSDLTYTYFDAFIIEEKTPNKKPIAIYPTKQNSRVFAQRGSFTLHGTIEDPLESIFDDCLQRIDIPMDSIEYAQQFLRLSGINEYSIFPDVDGLARYLIKRHCK